MYRTIIEISQFRTFTVDLLLLYSLLACHTLNFSPSLDKNWVRRCHHAIIPSGCAGDAIAGRGSHAVSRPRRRRGVRGAWPPDSRGSGIWFDTSVSRGPMRARTKPCKPAHGSNCHSAKMRKLSMHGSAEKSVCASSKLVGAVVAGARGQRGAFGSVGDMR